MVKARVARMRQLAEHLFPERHVYLRSNGETRGYVLTTGRQAALAAVAVLLCGWTVIATGGMLWGAFVDSRAAVEVQRTRAASERLNAELQARLNSAVARMVATSGSIDELSRTVERRHAALTQVMQQFRGVEGAQEALAPAMPLADERPPLERMIAVRMDQERLIARAATFADSRAERLRLAFRLAGLNPSAYAGGSVGLGGPLVEARDPRALAAVLDVDESFAVRIRSAVDGLSEMRALEDAAERLPFGRPAANVRTTSGFGVRFDPFNRRPALHQGQDFAGPFMTPIRATAPGVVSFAGVRNGYGNTVEIDHGGGFKTRYAHLQGYSVRAGQRVALGQRIGAMGSTGRSTGVHLHYEIWVNGRPQNPARFLRAGDHVVQQD